MKRHLGLQRSSVFSIVQVMLLLSACQPAGPQPGENSQTERPDTTPNNVLITPTAFLVETEFLPTATPELDGNGWKIYRNEKLGYSFHYPAEAIIITNDEPLKSLSISLPEPGGPQFGISHPDDRKEYRPPEGVNLEKWLSDHYLLMVKRNPPFPEVRQPDMEIAGTTAIHIRFERSPQSYAYDRYYFARSGQLYNITIGHTGDKEDWKLCNLFLESFQFGS